MPLVISDNIHARSFALLTHRLPSTQPLAYIVAQLYRASPLAYIIARLRLAFFKARTLLHYQLCRHNTYTRLKNSPLSTLSTYHIHEIEKITIIKYVDITENVYLF